MKEKLEGNSVQLTEIAASLAVLLKAILQPSTEGHSSAGVMQGGAGASATPLAAPAAYDQAHWGATAAPLPSFEGG